MDYLLGFSTGYFDGLIIRFPVNTNGHTFDWYLRVKSVYESAIFNFNPSEYELGYGEGLDQAALDGMTREDLEYWQERYEND